MYELNLNNNFHEEKIDPNPNLKGNLNEGELINKFNFAILSIREKFQLLELEISKEEVKGYIDFYEKFIRELHLLILQENI